MTTVQSSSHSQYRQEAEVTWYYTTMIVCIAFGFALPSLSVGVVTMTLMGLGASLTQAIALPGAFDFMGSFVVGGFILCTYLDGTQKLNITKDEGVWGFVKTGLVWHLFTFACIVALIVGLCLVAIAGSLAKAFLFGMWTLVRLG